VRDSSTPRLSSATPPPPGDDLEGIRATTPTPAQSPRRTNTGRERAPGQAGTEIERILVDGEDAVVFGEIRLAARPTGRPYRARFALNLTVRDGLIVRHHAVNVGPGEPDHQVQPDCRHHRSGRTSGGPIGALGI
jgi:hypothetical protein